jgi:hypothetical protein
MLSVLRTREQEQARNLRALGWSVKEIERELRVARSSVSVWVRHVELSPEARNRLIERTRLGPVIAAERKAARARDARQGHQDEGRRFARERGPEYRGGCMLYWAEGAKSRNQAAVANADPDLLALFVAFLRSEFGVPAERITIRCNLFADHVSRQREVEQFWLDRLGLPDSSLRKSHVNVYSKYSQKKRTNKLPYGTCTVCVNSTRIVQTIYGSIQEYGGFERPEWLD